jgi:carbon starvation protein
MLFVLVACGAVSGFHSLVAGGTVSKQLTLESQGRFISYGGMLTEGMVAVITVLLVGGGLYWVAPADGSVDMSVLGLRETLKAGGWIHVFGQGYGHIVNQMLPALEISVGSMIAVLALNTFVLTGLDTTVRINRFIIQELLGQKIPLFYNKNFTTGLIIVPVFLLGASDSWQKIWPIFGATNQLIAAVALFVISAYLIGVRRPTYFAVYPAIFMVVTTVAALACQAYKFFYGAQPNPFLGCTAVVLIGLGLFVGGEGWQAIRTLRLKELEPAPAEA